jgi:threonylcarbamoyladenosine tRNA methylthiotransferase MtaB
MNLPNFRPPVFSTLGCRLNAYETEAMKELAEAAGVEGAVVVNTCAVTAEGLRRADRAGNLCRHARSDAGDWQP